MKTILLCIFCLSFSLALAQSRKICDLPKTLGEISGLINEKGTFWGLNDGGNPAIIYRLDTATGNIIDSTTFVNASNVDWEELASNDSMVFIGDFGNNNGTRQDLKIYYFRKTMLGQKNVVVDTISFFYPNQSTFTSNALTLFDCEAMIATDTALYLLSKSIGDAVCRLYELPPGKGIYAARLVDSLQLNFWVTGASVINSKLYGCGYLYLGSFSNFFWHGNSIMDGKFSGQDSSESMQFSSSTQWESICQIGSRIFGACEASNGKPAALYEIYHQQTLGSRVKILPKIKIIPNPAEGFINVVGDHTLVGARLCILDSSGKLMYSAIISQPDTEIDILSLKTGNYSLLIMRNGATIGSLKFSKI